MSIKVAQASRLLFVGERDDRPVWAHSSCSVICPDRLRRQFFQTLEILGLPLNLWVIISITNTENFAREKR